MTKESQIISPEGYSILVISVLVAAALFFLHIAAGFLGILWVGFCVYFFRNPRRQQPEVQRALISPADGTVIRITEAVEPTFTRKKMQMISVFMSPFNVHVNRVPATGQIKGVQHHKGQFKAAFDEKASDVNERCAVWMITKDLTEVVFVQVAGWFARRIVTYAKPGDCLDQGAIFGVIKFGSRVDLYFSEDYDVVATLNQKVKAGQTVLAKRKET